MTGRAGWFEILGRLPGPPASLFGIVLGTAGLANGWRVAARVWGLASLPGEMLHLLAGVIWFVLTLLYAVKWIARREEAEQELNHPVQCCFIGLAGVAAMLVGSGVLPHSRVIAVALIFAGAIYALAFAVWRTGILWQGDRNASATTPVLYLPGVAGSFVATIALADLGHMGAAQMTFGAGFLSWLAIESVLIHRLYTAPALAPALRPTLGIQLAPPTVGCAAYLSIANGAPDLFAHGLLGYGLLQALLLVRLLPWIREQPFAPSYWAFTFGATALATDTLRMLERGDVGPVVVLAPVLFVLVNAVLIVIALGTLRIWFASSRHDGTAASRTSEASRESVS